MQELTLTPTSETAIDQTEFDLMINQMVEAVAMTTKMQDILAVSSVRLFANQNDTSQITKLFSTFKRKVGFRPDAFAAWIRHTQGLSLGVGKSGVVSCKAITGPDKQPLRYPELIRNAVAYCGQDVTAKVLQGMGLTDPQDAIAQGKARVLLRELAIAKPFFTKSEAEVAKALITPNGVVKRVNALRQAIKEAIDKLSQRVDLSNDEAEQLTALRAQHRALGLNLSL